jgi:adenylate cyclase class 2
MADYTETEIKLYCPDLDTVAATLADAGAVLVTPRVFERNVRYENIAGTFGDQGIVLRLRQDERIRLTYKGPGTLTNDIMHRYEAEVEVDNLETMGAILENLGFHPHMIYEKYRSTYTLAGVEIVLDEMPYGNFVEIEGETSAIEAMIQRLGLETAPRFGQSYVGLFDTVCRALSLSLSDLTFANFAGIDVPKSAFLPQPD